jgi:hypothetical protein
VGVLLGLVLAGDEAALSLGYAIDYATLEGYEGSGVPDGLTGYSEVCDLRSQVFALCLKVSLDDGESLKVDHRTPPEMTWSAATTFWT